MKSAIIYTICLGMFLLVACGEKTEGNTNANAAGETKEAIDPMQDKGVGPITSLSLPATINEKLAAEGKEVYDKMCTACHKVDKKYIGPAPAGIMERRTPEWIMNMILAPEKMIVENEAAKQLLMEYNGAPMANQNLKEEEARAILEYFRTLK